MNYYAPGQAAEETGFSLDTLRYYERIGLLPAIGRTAGGRRRFTDADLAWLRLLRCLRDSGMPIAEMLRFMQLSRVGEDTVPDRIALLEEHDRRIEEQIARLRRDQEKVRGKADFYRGKLRNPGDVAVRG